MPVQPNNETFYIELDHPAAVSELIDVARGLDPAKVARVVSKDGRVAADVSDHLMFLAATNPDWFAPFRDEAVTELSDVLRLNLADAALLLSGTSERATKAVCRRLDVKPTSWSDLSLLAGIGGDTALIALADHVRRHPGAGQWVNRLGVHVGRAGGAVRRFSPHRYAMHALSGSQEADGWIGLPIETVAEGTDLITWHYLSFQPELVEGLPAWPHALLHIVSPRTYWFTVQVDVAVDGRYVNPVVDDEGEPFDAGMAEQEADPPPSQSFSMRRYDADLVYRNGHISLTPGACGTAGGPPVGIYPNPICPGCGVLMFHGGTVESSVRPYGEGFRSVFYCENCIRVSVTGTNWN